NSPGPSFEIGHNYFVPDPPATRAARPRGWTPPYERLHHPPTPGYRAGLPGRALCRQMNPPSERGTRLRTLAQFPGLVTRRFVLGDPGSEPYAYGGITGRPAGGPAPHHRVPQPGGRDGAFRRIPAAAPEHVPIRGHSRTRSGRGSV